jgi:hypothetical protein
VDLTFSPRIEEKHRIELLLLRSELHWVLGSFSGNVVTDAGETLRIEDLLGWSEEFCARW